MKLNYPFSLLRLFFAIFGAGNLVFGSLICAAAEDEGTGNLFTFLGALPFRLLWFPAKWMMGDEMLSIPNIFWALMVNALFYGLLAEMLLAFLLRRYNNHQPFRSKNDKQ